MAYQTPVIAKDGTIYIRNAILFSAGEFKAGMNTYPPVYPVFISLASKVIETSEAAAQGVSIVMGALTILPFFALTRSIFGTKIAQMASVLFVFQPALVQNSGDTLSESTYLFFFLAALNAGWHGWRDGQAKDCLLFGLCAALAYLTRPEGIGLVVGMTLWIGVGFWRYRKAAASALSVKKVVMGLLPILLLIVPYLLHTRTTTGEWRINAKRDMVAASGLAGVIAPQTPATQEPMSDRSAPSTNATQRQRHYAGFVETRSLAQFVGRYLQTFVLLTIEYMEVVHPVLFLFVIYLFSQRKAFSYHPEGESFLAGFYLFYLAGLALLYVDGRHLLQLVPLTLPWAAAGLIEGAKHFESLVADHTRRIEGPVPVQSLLLALVLIALFPQTFAPHRADKMALREAAAWIHAQKGYSRILSTDSRVAYYAKGRHIEVRNMAKLNAMLRRYKPDWAVLEGEGISPLNLPDTIPAFSMKKVFQTGEGPTAYRVIVYGTGQT
jgi:4-amino-4-deoxy-L-arabinose transferase-like glycosyltransferase